MSAACVTASLAGAVRAPGAIRARRARRVAGRTVRSDSRRADERTPRGGPIFFFPNRPPGTPSPVFREDHVRGNENLPRAARVDAPSAVRFAHPSRPAPPRPAHRRFRIPPQPRLLPPQTHRFVRAALGGSDDAAKDGSFGGSEDDASSADAHDASDAAPLTPGDLSRAARRAAAAAADRKRSPSLDGSAGSDDYPFSLDDHSATNNSVGPMARGVCWSNLQDLEDVPDHEPVYILVFGAGTGSEGLYSLQERTKEDVPVDIILGFPAEEDALRYGTLLEAEMGRVPVVESARPEDLRYTCREGGYRCKVARRGVLLMPPEKTVEVTDWERTNALRQGQWSVDQMAGSGNGGGGSGAAEGKARRESTGAVAEEEVPDTLAQYKAIIDGYCATPTGEEDELCQLPDAYDEASAREMLARLFDVDVGEGDDPDRA